MKHSGFVALAVVLGLLAFCNKAFAIGGYWKPIEGKPYTVKFTDEANNVVAGEFKKTVRWEWNKDGAVIITEWDDQATFAFKDQEGKEHQIDNGAIKSLIVDLDTSFAGKLKGDIFIRKTSKPAPSTETNAVKEGSVTTKSTEAMTEPNIAAKEFIDPNRLAKFREARRKELRERRKSAQSAESNAPKAPMPAEDVNKSAGQSSEKKETGSDAIVTSQPKYEKPKSYDSTVTTTYNKEKYTIHVAPVYIPQEGVFPLPYFEAEPNSIYFGIADNEMRALLRDETVFAEGAAPTTADNKSIAATIELLDTGGPNKLIKFKATSGPDGMHIALPLSGYFNLGDGLACDVKIFDRKVIIKPGSLTIVGINWGPMRHYTFAEGACIVAINGKLTAYGIKRSQ